MTNENVKFLFPLGAILILFGVFLFNKAYSPQNEEKKLPLSKPEKIGYKDQTLPSPTPSPSPSPIPLPDPKVYGPCKNVPVLLYHHIQPKQETQDKNQVALTTYADFFQNQLSYLQQKGYTTITPSELLNGLTSGFSGKPVLLTFDDAYEDFYKYTYPLLVKHGMKATVFVPTGLVNNPDYLSWQQIEEMKSSGLITFANHTWSHKNLGAAGAEYEREITTAQTQLADHGIVATSFAYPYGVATSSVQEILTKQGITTAFTTVPGNYQCAKLPFDFRRMRIGNLPLSSYGL